MNIEFADKLKEDLKKQLMRSHIILRDYIFVSSLTTKTSAFIDPNYIPFYYYLNKYISPNNLLEVGFGLGLLSGAFLRNNKSVSKFVGFQTPDIKLPSRFNNRNIRSVYKGEFELIIGEVGDERLSKNKWDLVIFDKDFEYNDARRMYDIIWDSLNENSYMVIDNLVEERGKPFLDFCKIHQLDPIIIRTRYGTGIIKKE